MMADDRFDDFLSVLLPTIVLTALVHGGYIVLFILCLYLLFTRPIRGVKWHIFSSIVQFMLSTVSIILLTYYQGTSIRSEDPGTSHPLRHLQPVNWIFLAISYIFAEIVLLRRCYAIWNHNKKVLAVPCILLLAATGLGMYEVSQEFEGSRVTVFILFGLMMVINVLVTSLSATRIWWLTRRASTVVGQRFRGRLTTAITIILESGLIYSVVLLGAIIAFVLNSREEHSMMLTPATFWFIALSVQFSGIMITLLIVRVGLGITSTDVVYSVGLANLSLSTRASVTAGYEMDAESDFSPVYDKSNRRAVFK